VRGAVAVAATALLSIATLVGTGGPTPARHAVLTVHPTAIVSPTAWASGPPTTSQCLASSGGTTACYDPAQVRAAYDLAPLFARGVQGQRQTIVIVDAFGDPTIRSDLATFDAAFSLPAPPALRVLTPRGPIPPYSASGKDRFGWAAETALDVEWAHVMAPKAAIDLVETPTDEVEGTTGFPDIVAAENWVVRHRLGTVISQSFAATEETFTSKSQLLPFRSAYVAAQKAGVSVLAGSGDLGATDYEYDATTIYPRPVVSWPATDPLVTAVGGTKLDLSAAGTPLAPAVAWNDTYLHSVPHPSASGGGRSAYFSRPAYQGGVATQALGHRGVPDVSMSAACTGLVEVYLGAAGPQSPGWRTLCGTSEATPLFAGIVALCDQELGHGLGLLNPALYGLLKVAGSGLVPVRSGNNTVAFVSGAKTVTVRGFTATGGYSLVTGVGTIDAARFVPALVKEWRALAR
jgi:subtilase family serine protease